jgi:hypothetical protein
MIEDKALRDSALRLFKSDLALIRGDLHERPVGARLSDRVGDAAMDMLDDAVDYAEENKGKVAAGIAAAVLWFGRGLILDALESWLGSENDEDDAEPGGEPARSGKSRNLNRPAE